MATRRMFSKTIVDTDAFMDMPSSTQMLYFHLAMRADDDGFISSPKKIMKMIGSQDDDMKVLTTKRFILLFDSGVIVIKHWRMHNLIRSDRYTETNYIKEKEQLVVDEKTKKYSLGKPHKVDVIPDGNQSQPQVRIGEDSLVKLKEQLKPFSTSYPPKILIDFELYWGEKNAKGKERWELEKTWDIKRRLQRWKRNQEDREHQQNQRFLKKDEKPKPRENGGSGFQSMANIINN